MLGGTVPARHEAPQGRPKALAPWGNGAKRRSGGSYKRQGAYAMVMVLPFVLGLAAALLAVGGRRNAALGLGIATVVIQVWWLAYHATDTLAVSL